MSYFDDASLVMIPSGYKDQKVYSVKPTDGSGDLTFSRASDATRVDSNGLIEKVRTNYLLNSNTFSTTWTNNNSTETSGQAGYDGTNNAWFLTAAGTSSAYIEQSITSSGLKNYSVYLKKGTSSFAALTFEGTGGGFSYFNLNTGAVGTSSVVTPSIQSVGSGWYRCSISAAPSGITGVRIYVTDADNSTNVTNGNNILMQAAQLEDGDVATNYIATTSAAVSVGPVSGLPRLDYLNSSCPRLLLEPQRTNLVTYSEQFNVSGWTTLNVGVTANQSTSPDGYTDADSLANTSTTNAIDFYRVFTATAASVYTLSCFAKSGTFTKAVLRFYSGQGAGQETQVPAVTFDLANGVVLNEYGLVTDSSITSYGNGWYRLTMTSAAVGTTGYACVLPLSNTATWNTTYQYPSNLGSLGNIQIFGYQAELGAYATSYIPTLGTSVTRVADAASKTGISSLIGQTEGTLFGELTYTGIVPSMHLFSSVAGSYASAIYVENSSSNRISMQVWSGATQQVFIITGSYTVGQNIKFAAAYKNNDFVFYVNGTQIGTDTSGTVPSGLSQLEVGGYAEAGSPFNYSSSMKQAIVFPVRLSNSDLAALTA